MRGKYPDLPTRICWPAPVGHQFGGNAWERRRVSSSWAVSCAPTVDGGYADLMPCRQLTALAPGPAVTLPPVICAQTTAATAFLL